MAVDAELAQVEPRPLGRVDDTAVLAGTAETWIDHGFLILAVRDTWRNGGPIANRKRMPKRQGSQPDRSGVKPGEDNLRRNVAAIVAGEQEVMDARSPAEKFSDQIAKHAGRAWSIVAHIVWFGGWIVLNSRLMPEAWRFDPFPYQFLTLVVSLEAIFLSLFILMSQNRATRQADQRSHLDLQINLLAEQESTKILQMLQSLCAFHQLPIADDPDVENLKAATDPAKLLQELKAGMP